MGQRRTHLYQRPWLPYRWHHALATTWSGPLGGYGSRLLELTVIPGLLAQMQGNPRSIHWFCLPVSRIHIKYYVHIQVETYPEFLIYFLPLHLASQSWAVPNCKLATPTYINGVV